MVSYCEGDYDWDFRGEKKVCREERGTVDETSSPEEGAVKKA